MLSVSNFFYNIWIGDAVKISFRLSLFMFMYVILYSFGGIFVTFINGTGKIKLQMYSAIVGMIVFIPLAVLFAKILNMGISGIVLAMIVANFYGPIVAPIQYYKINKTAHGIWNKWKY